MSEREARSATKELRKAKSSSKSPSRNKSPVKSTGRPKKKDEPAKKSPGRPRSKSPARKKSPVRSKSPARPKSPARNKSPARKKSPARNKSLTEKNQESPPSNNTAGVLKRISVLRDSPRSRASSQQSTVNSVEPTESDDDSFNERVIRSRVSRFQDKIAETVKRASATKPFNDVSNKTDATNSMDSTPLIPLQDKAAAVLKTLFAVLSIVVAHLLGIISLFSCTKESCKSNVKIPWSSWEKYLNVEASLLLLGFFIVHTLITLIPLTKPVSGYSHSYRSSLTHRCNGFLNWLVTIAGIIGAYYFKCPLTKLLEKMPLLFAPSCALALILAIIIYAVSVPDAHSKRSNFIVEFIFGKSVCVRLGALDFKTAVTRTTLCSCIVYFTVVAIAEIERKANYTQFSYSLLVLCFLNIFFMSDAFLFESDSVSTYYMQQEMYGYMSTAILAMFPFLLSTSASYLFYNKIADNKYMIGLTCVLFLIGYLLYRIGLHQKASFRKQPVLYSNCDVVVSREGRNLLASGLWGFVRHPNYLGCIIMYWSFVPLVYTHWPVLILPILITIEHIARVYTVEQHCRSTHSTAWNYYTNKVPYRLIPFIY